jgi:hypothetical protein
MMVAQSFPKNYEQLLRGLHGENWTAGTVAGLRLSETGCNRPHKYHSISFKGVGFLSKAVAGIGV